MILCYEDFEKFIDISTVMGNTKITVKINNFRYQKLFNNFLIKYANINLIKEEKLDAYRVYKNEMLKSIK